MCAARTRGRHGTARRAPFKLPMGASPSSWEAFEWPEAGRCKGAGGQAPLPGACPWGRIWGDGSWKLACGAARQGLVRQVARTLRSVPG